MQKKMGKNGRYMNCRHGEEAWEVSHQKERQKLGYEDFLSFGTKKMAAKVKKKLMKMAARRRCRPQMSKLMAAFERGPSNTPGYHTLEFFILMAESFNVI